MSRRLKTALWLLTLLLPLSMSGCCDRCTDPDDDAADLIFRPRTSPQNLLHNLLKAYQYREIAEVESLLADDFAFYFSDGDTSRPGIPESWDRIREIDAHEGMFDREFVQSLSMEFAVDSIVPDPEYANGEDSVWVAGVNYLDLDLFGIPRSHPGEPPQYYKVEDSRAQFWFRRSSRIEPTTGEPIWTIIKCKETTTTNWLLRPLRPCPAESTSWGVIKVLFE
jgi:hypothetical protein